MLHKFAQRKGKGVCLVVDNISKIGKEDGPLVLRLAKKFAQMFTLTNRDL